MRFFSTVYVIVGFKADGLSNIPWDAFLQYYGYSCQVPSHWLIGQSIIIQKIRYSEIRFFGITDAFVSFLVVGLLDGWHHLRNTFPRNYVCSCQFLDSWSLLSIVEIIKGIPNLLLLLRLLAFEIRTTIQETPFSSTVYTVFNLSNMGHHPEYLLFWYGLCNL